MDTIAATDLALSAVAIAWLCYSLIHCYRRPDTLRALGISLGSWWRLWIPWWGWSAILVISFVLGLRGTTAVSRTETPHPAEGAGLAAAQRVSATIRLPFYVRTPREVQGPGGTPIQRATTTSLQIPWLFLLVASTYWVIVTVRTRASRA